jgi:hypothetical protein
MSKAVFSRKIPLLLKVEKAVLRPVIAYPIMSLPFIAIVLRPYGTILFPTLIKTIPYTKLKKHIVIFNPLSPIPKTNGKPWIFLW